MDSDDPSRETTDGAQAEGARRDSRETLADDLGVGSETEVRDRLVVERERRHPLRS